MKTDQIREVYDRHASRYDRAGGMLERLVTGEMRAELGTHLYGRVLEIAIGTGRNLPFYSADVTHVTGVDLSRAMLDQAQMKLDALGLAGELVQMDAERLEFADQAFDCVVVSEALCTIPRPDVALAELFRVCRTGGTAVFLEHVRSPHTLVHQLQRLVTPIPQRSIGCSWTRDTVSAIGEAGFQILSDRSRLMGVFHLVVTTRP